MKIQFDELLMTRYFFPQACGVMEIQLALIWGAKVQVNNYY